MAGIMSQNTLNQLVVTFKFWNPEYGFLTNYSPLGFWFNGWINKNT